jgi:hypothetical protein
MNPSSIRRHVIRALFADPDLCERFVIKGGNALALIHEVVDRASLDVDVSIEQDLDDLVATGQRLEAALRSEFDPLELVVIDFSLTSVPPALSEDRKTWWGGYRLEFKIVPRMLHEEHVSDPAALRRRALTINPMQGRTIRVDISRGEWCAGKIRRDLDGRTIFVYTEEMCVVEKFRALCQQLPVYRQPLQSRPVPRARDFFDIYTVVTRRGVDLLLPENLDLFRLIFPAKRVPVELLREIQTTRQLHETDWPAVIAAVPGRVASFETYFDFTTRLADAVADRLLSR